MAERDELEAGRGVSLIRQPGGAAMIQVGGQPGYCSGLEVGGFL